MSTTHPIARELDGVRFEGVVGTAELEDRPDLGPVVSTEEVEGFERLVVEAIAEIGLRGPESFRFVRRFCELSMTALGEHFEVDRRTVQRWESGETPIPIATASALYALALDGAGRRLSMRALLDAMRAGDDERPRSVEIRRAA